MAEKYMHDKEAKNVLLYLVNKLNVNGIPVTEEEWEVYRRHLTQITEAIHDRTSTFEVGSKTYAVSPSFIKFAHNMLYITEKYYMDVRAELKGGTT